MIRFLQEMDWSTPLRQVNRAKHWRVFLAAFLCALPALAVWWFLFPNTFWFTKLWGAFAIGGSLGILLGQAWQLKAPSRRGKSSGRLLVWSVFAGGAVFFPVTIFFLGPSLHGEEVELAKIRTLRATDVVAISVQLPDCPQVTVTDHERINSFVKRCHRSNLFYPSHESFTNKSLITINFSDGTAWTYEMGIPERHLNDLVITFRNHMQYSHILIPDAAEWFEAMEAYSGEST